MHCCTGRSDIVHDVRRLQNARKLDIINIFNYLIIYLLTRKQEWRSLVDRQSHQAHQNSINNKHFRPNLFQLLLSKEIKAILIEFAQQLLHVRVLSLVTVFTITYNFCVRCSEYYEN